MKAWRFLAVGVLGAAVAAGLSSVGALDGAERLALDLRHRARAPRALPPELRVVAATDGDTETLGAWPWDRRVHAQMLKCLREAGAKAVGFDVLFEDQGLSPEGDALLSQTVEEAGGVVVAAAFDWAGTREGDALPADAVARLSLPVPQGSRFARAMHVVFPPKSLRGGAQAIGFLDAPADADGVIRSVWILLEHGGRLYPSLPLALLLALDGSTLDAVRVDAPDRVRVLRPGGREVVIPLDGEGRALLEFPGAVETVPVRSYHEVFYDYLQKGAGGLSDVRGGITLVGNVMASVSDARGTPLEGNVPGLFVQVAALSDLLEGRFLRRAGPALWLPALAVHCLLAAWAAARLAGWRRVVACVACWALPIAAGLAAFSWAGLVVPMATPIMGVVVATLVAATLSELARARKRRSVDRVFQRFLPPGVLDRVLADSDRHLHALERAEVSMLMARLVGWDALRLAPEEEGALLREFFASVAETVHAERGTLLNVSADGVFAIWNRPLRVEGHPAAAVKTAFALRDAVKALNARWIERAGAPVGLAAAVHTGLATVGTVGSEFHAQYAAFGREVSLTARLLAQAGEGQVLASERTNGTVVGTVESVLHDQTTAGGVYELTPPVT